MRIGLLFVITLLLASPSFAQTKIIAEGEYGHRSGDQVQKLENGGGHWTVTATQDGNFEFHHKVGNSEQSFAFDKNGIPRSSRLSAQSGNGTSLIITCE